MRILRLDRLWCTRFTHSEGIEARAEGLLEWEATAVQSSRVVGPYACCLGVWRLVLAKATAGEVSSTLQPLAIDRPP